MSEYYAVQRSGEYLEHYGVKGMKWGVRKAIQSGNSRALGRQYKKALKKLAKLEKRGANGKKYAKRAAAYGAGAAAAGGLAALGTSGASRVVRSAGMFGSKATRVLGGAMSKAGGAAGRLATSSVIRNAKLRTALGRGATALSGAGKAVSGASGAVKSGAQSAARAVGKWGSNSHLTNSVADRLGKIAAGSKTNNAVRKYAAKGASAIKGVSNNTLARIGAGAVGAGLGVAAARNAYKAATAKRNRQKAAQFRAEMNKAFAGTQYVNGGTNRQGKRRKKRS